MNLEEFLVATGSAHVGFTLIVVTHAYYTGRRLGKWPLATLIFGLAGVAAYFFYDRDVGLE